ncbi:MAG TPA: hypothetical protein VF988_15980 [Verrucomicrobiae bacterium]
MALKITNNSLFSKHQLVLEPGSVKFYESTLLGGSRRFSYERIDCVLLSPDNKLSFQVAAEVFSIPVRPGDPQHQPVIDAFVQAVQNSLSANR